VKPIAIIGIGARFPGAESPAALWRLASDGKSAVREVPADRWSLEEYFAPDAGTPGKMSSRVGGFVDGVELFDAAHFGISPREAAQMDPQQRILLEVCWETLEDAGMPPRDLAGRSVAAYIGVQRNDYSRVMTSPEQFNAFTVAGNQFSMTVSRLSHVYDLRGPALAIDAGCSSVLAAVHMACGSLETGECELAIAGGVHLCLAPHDSIAVSQAWMLSPSGACKSFDAGADGFVRSEGCGVFLLKPLEAALRAGDPIRAIVRGTAFFQEGRPGGFTSPWGPEIERTARRALERSGVPPASIHYVEGHGVGSPVGDATEYSALARLLGGEDRSEPCFIGSVKPNIGHSESAAGGASLAKAIQVLEHGEIPPLIGFERFGVDVDEKNRTLTIPSAKVKFPGASPRRALVNAFGLGGTNATLVIEEAPRRGSEPASGTFAMCLSARTPSALAELARRFDRFLVENPEVSVAEACGASLRRASLQHRAVILGDSIAELRRGLTSLIESTSAPHLTRGESLPRDPRELLYLRSGAWPERTVAELTGRCPQFRDAHAAAISDGAGGDQALALAATAMWRSLGLSSEGIVTDGAMRICAAVAAGAGSYREVSACAARRSTDGLAPLSIPVYSAMSGRPLSLHELLDGASEPAAPASEVLAAHARECDFLLDVPGGALFDARRREPLFAHQEGIAWLFSTLAALWVRGTDIDFRKLEEARASHVALPSYPFERQRYWVDERGPGSGQPPTFEAARTVDVDRAATPEIDLATITDDAARQRAITTVLRRSIATTLGRPEAEIPVDVPLRDQAIASVDLLQMMVHAHKLTGIRIDPTRVMDQPSIEEIASRIVFGTGGDLTSVDLSAEGNLDAGIDASALPTPASPPRTILLTGGTGFLGAFILGELLERTDATIYCLVRAVDSLEGEQRLAKNLARYDLPTANLTERVRVIVGDLDQPLLGLSYERFDLLGARLDAIYHVGALVNWAYPYRSLMAANVQGTEEVIRLASHLKRKPIHHVSTVGVFPIGIPQLGVLGEKDGLVVPGHSAWLGTGYNQSKWVAEKLLYTAGARRGVPVSIYRPGFVTGRTDTGATQLSRHDFIAAFLKGVIHMRAAPRLDLALDLMPVDYLARAIVELSRKPAAPGHPLAFNMVNPTPLKYEGVYQLLRDDGYAIETVDYAPWRDRVLALAHDPGDHPLFPFWPYWAAITEERRAALEQHMGERMPLDDAQVRARLAPTPLRCPSVRELLPVYTRFFREVGYLPAT
jgi:thioester reductase-like protein